MAPATFGAATFGAQSLADSVMHMNISQAFGIEGSLFQEKHRNSYIEWGQSKTLVLAKTEMKLWEFQDKYVQNGAQRSAISIDLCVLKDYTKLIDLEIGYF